MSQAETNRPLILSNEFPWMPVICLMAISSLMVTVLVLGFPKWIEAATDIARFQNLVGMEPVDLAIRLHSEGLLPDDVPREKVGEVEYLELDYERARIVCRFDEMPRCSVKSAFAD